MNPWSSVRVLRKGKYEGTAGVIVSVDFENLTALVKLDFDGACVDFKFADLQPL